MQAYEHAFRHQQCFAYPTEAVFGLGCDPLSEKAVMEILRLKSRPVEKGLILIAANFEQLAPFVQINKLPIEHQRKVHDSWPGPFTWLLPKSDLSPSWLSGDSELLAVRVTNHPLVQQMCEQLNSPMVSTSANPAGLSPARTSQEVRTYFGDDLVIVDGSLGEQQTPSTIINGLDLQTLRA
jgi:tRNA threonylcarbamoyl adenosine modification protein (Sua5/YciO/YrdC/YwlC family)